jgi:polysaccharide chain length determinant protein (PEP-CTERM system associated)
MTDTLDRLRAIWKRRKWLGVLAFAVPLTIGLTVVAAMPSLYRATVTVLVIRQEIPEKLVAPTVTSAVETRLKTISQEILSRPRLEALRERFGLYRDLQTRIPPDQVIERMRADINLELKGVETRAETQGPVAFTLSYQGTAPKTVAAVANTLASYYIEENVKARELQASGTAEFLRVQLEQTKQRLDQQERAVSEFKRRYMGELPQQMEPNLATLERLQMQLRLNADGQTRAQERRSFLSAQLSEAGSLSFAGPAGPSGAPESGPARLARLQQSLTELRSRYSDKYPDVVQTQAEVAALTRELADAKARGASESAPSTVPNPVASPLRGALTEAETELKVLKAEDGRLRASIAAYQQRIEKIPEREQEFKELARDYETTRDVYQSLLKRHGDAQIAESMEQRQKSEQFRIIEAAAVPTRPVASPLKLLIIVLVVAIDLAVAAVFVAEKLDASFHTIEQVRGRTSLPVLVSIPKIVTTADAAWQRTRFRLATTATGIGLFLLAAVSYFLAHGNEQLVTLLLRSRP